MKWYFRVLIGLLIITLFLGLCYWEVQKWKVPFEVQERQGLVKKALNNETVTEIGMTLEKAIFESPRTPSWLLYWTGRYLEYANPEWGEAHPLNMKLKTLRSKEDHMDPNTIIEYGVGRCEEFSILFAAFCKASGYDARLVYDLSMGVSEAGKRNGDHVWVEVNFPPPGISNEDYLKGLENGTYWWCHIEPTDGAIWAVDHISTMSPTKNPFINDPEMYERDRLKDLHRVWAIEFDYCEEVTERYQYEET